MSFDFIKLGTQRKTYTHDKSFDNNTTMDFGGVQPLMFEYMFPNSTISVNTRQLVRLAPMPTPSFARINLLNYARFVPISDVVSYHECLLANQPYFNGTRSFVPSKMPYTTNQTLMFFLLSRCNWCGYIPVTAGTYSLVQPTSTSDFARIRSSYHQRLGFGSTISDKYSHFALSEDLFSIVSPEEADYIVYTERQDGTTGEPYIICFKFTAPAARCRKVFTGLGYGLELNDTTPVSLAPLLCFYKSYFDTFGLTRVYPYTSTNCFSIVRLISDYEIDWTMSVFRNFGNPDATPYTRSHYLWYFLKDLCSCYYNSANNFLAAHRSSVNNNASSILVNTTAGTTSPGSSTISNDKGSYPSLVPQGGFTQVALDTLRKLSRFVAKDSAIGMRINDWVRVHYGADVANSLFEESNFVSKWSTAINIDDVFSTSDTVVENSNDGEYLGSYAGKGLGFDKSSFKFHANVHGYFFVFSCIVPIVHDFVGTDPTLYSVDMNGIPIPEYDALGFEVTPRAAVIGDNFVSTLDNKPDGVSFGFVPRYTGYKIKKDIVNGQMYQGHFKRDLHPYYLDRIPYNNNLTVESSGSSTTFKPKGLFNVCPNASTSWQTIGLSNTNGNFNRLFYNEGTYDFSDTYIDDNFIVQTIFDVKVKNFLKPIQDSYDTFDGDDNSSHDEKTN